MATAANVVKLKRSAVAGRVPATTDLALGEIALNTYDGRVYLKKSVSAVESVVTLQPFPTGGTSGYVLQTDGSGNLSWVEQAAASTPYRLLNNGYSATLGSNGTLTVDNLTVTAETNVTTQSFVVTSIGNLLLSEDGQVLELPPNQAPITTENFNSVIIGANTGSFYFTSGGKFQLPPNGDVIDANGNSVLSSMAGVSYALVQTLTTNQKATARTNIDAVGQEDIFVAAIIMG
jgi:flagellar basal body rod protein FlgG